MRGIYYFLLGFFIFSEAFSSIHVPLKGPDVPNSLQTCQIHFDIQEKDKGLPEKLLSAISTVESKHKPWAINAQGQSKNFKTKEEAANYIRQLRTQGVRNINVGCMQLNWESHAKHFKSPEDMLEPSKNVDYAAQLVKRLIKQHGSVEKGVRFYHSASSTHNIAYKNRVYAMWFQIKRSPSHQVIKENKKTSQETLKSPKTLKLPKSFIQNMKSIVASERSERGHLSGWRRRFAARHDVFSHAFIQRSSSLTFTSLSDSLVKNKPSSLSAFLADKM